MWPTQQALQIMDPTNVVRVYSSTCRLRWVVSSTSTGCETDPTIHTNINHHQAPINYPYITVILYWLYWDILHPLLENPRKIEKKPKSLETRRPSWSAAWERLPPVAQQPGIVLDLLFQRTEVHLLTSHRGFGKPRITPCSTSHHQKVTTTAITNITDMI